MRYIATIDGRDFHIEIEGEDRISVDGVTYAVDLKSIDGQSLFSLIINGRSYEIFVERQARQYFVTIAGDRYLVEVDDERMKRLREQAGVQHEETGAFTIVAPMPGLVVKVVVEEGQTIAAGQGVVILEAMKMENEIRSPRDGIIERIRVRAGQTVEQGGVMIEVSPLPGSGKTGGTDDATS